MESPEGSPPDLRSVFGRLESGSSAGSADMFAEQFLNLDPARAMVVTRDQLSAALPQRQTLFAAAGIRGTRLQHLDVRPLDALHQLADTEWAAEFDDPNAEPLTLRSTFLVRLVDGAWRIVVYLNHQDIVTELARRATR
ncbi:MAG TPA: hypothetical protein VFM01_12285 [Nakamurella sp.]|nr:hypothetical protein [Nakamurella sp.]